MIFKEVLGKSNTKENGKWKEVMAVLIADEINFKVKGLELRCSR